MFLLGLKLVLDPDPRGIVALKQTKGLLAIIYCKWWVRSSKISVIVFVRTNPQIADFRPPMSSPFEIDLALDPGGLGIKVLHIEN
jgi:hypothetical protein